MQSFHCDHCQQLVFFENVACLRCGHALAYLPDLRVVGSLEPMSADTWRSPLTGAHATGYRLCRNYVLENVCNWAVPADDANPLCNSCRLTRLIPDLTQPGNREAWYRIEVAKRRLLHTLLSLGLPVQGKHEDPERGLAFEFLASAGTPQAEPVLTGHSNGVITLNVAEADDAQREQVRMRLHEPYRTLLGHFRHEIGHYYWGRLVAGSDWLDGFRQRFADERADYSLALERHYASGPTPDWQQRFVSEYASAHPWEDWAETWAHYLHITDTLETAAASGLSLRPRRPDEPSLDAGDSVTRSESFERIIEAWFPLTYLLNNLNRGMGLPDGYPFVLSAPAVDKLRFVHEVIEAHRVALHTAH